jgi:hypothetical protein
MVVVRLAVEARCCGSITGWAGVIWLIGPVTGDGGLNLHEIGKDGG